jgi:hypothetical protein
VAWKVTVRDGPRVEHEQYDELDAALEAVEAHGRQLASQTERNPVGTQLKRYEPAQQVSARIELAGPQRLLPNVRAGLDIRGDGSVEAYLGHLRREPIEQRKGESPYKALRRSLDKRG